MAATNPGNSVIFKGNQSEILALVNPKAKWKEAERTLVAQAAAQHRILPQLRLVVDLQNRSCGLKSVATLEKELRKAVGDNLSIGNYRVRASAKNVSGADSALILARDLAATEIIQTTKDVVVIGSVPEGAHIETVQSCFIFGTIRGAVRAGTRGKEGATIVCLDIAGGASLCVGTASAVLHVAPAGMRGHYYVATASQGQLRVQTHFVE